MPAYKLGLTHCTASPAPPVCSDSSLDDLRRLVRDVALEVAAVRGHVGHNDEGKKKYVVFTADATFSPSIFRPGLLNPWVQNLQEGGASCSAQPLVSGFTWFPLLL